MNPHSSSKGILSSVSPISWSAIFLIAIHVLIIEQFHTLPLEMVLSGSLELASAVVALFACYQASRRSHEFPRPFWVLLGSTVFLWSVGQALYLFNQFYLRSSNLNPNILLFVFFIATAPLSIAVLYKTRSEQDAPRWLPGFDAAQVVAIILAACLLNFDLALGKTGFRQMETRLLTLHARNVLLSVGLLVRAVTSRDKARELYAPVSFAFSFFTLSAWIGNQAIEVWGMRMGEWCDLSWSVPFAIIAVAAAQWQNHPVRTTQLLEGSWRIGVRRVADYFVPFSLAFCTVILAVKGMALQREIAAALILTSVLLFFARTSVLQCHRDRLLNRLQSVLDNTKRLTGYLPICAACKMIRDDDGSWQQLESYICQHSEAEFTHGICPDCAYRLYPDHAKNPSC